jgi:addiction module HigA family antidote
VTHPGKVSYRTLLPLSIFSGNPQGIPQVHSRVVGQNVHDLVVPSSRRYPQHLSDERVSKIGIQPPHPGDFIKTEILDELHLSIARAAEILGVRRATLSDLIHGKVSLSPEMALRIEKAFDVSMGMLLRMQAWYDTYTMRQRAGEIEVRRYEPV